MGSWRGQSRNQSLDQSRALWQRQIMAQSQGQIMAPDTTHNDDPADHDGYEQLPDVVEVDEQTAQRFAHIPRKAQQIAALRAAGSTMQEIADLCGDTIENIRYHVRKWGLQRVSPLTQHAAKAFLAARFDRVCHRALSKVTDAKLEEASAPALLTVAGIATDKALRIRESIEAARESADVAGLAAALRGQLQARTPQ